GNRAAVRGRMPRKPRNTDLARLFAGGAGRIGVRDTVVPPQRGASILTKPDISGATATPRKTNYGFERREREKNKAAESAKKAQAKAEKKASANGAEPGDSAQAPNSDQA